MSALRINVPGEPVRHIDLGPAVGRLTGRGIGGSLVQGNTNAERILPSTTPARRAQMAEYRARRGEGPVVPLHAETCGRTMPVTGMPCARRPRHNDYCKDRRAMDQDSLRRRSRQR